MKGTTLLVAALLVLQVPCTETARSAEQGGRRFSDEIARQEEIYKTDDESVLAGYVVDRSLRNYTRVLLPDFDPALAKLGPEDRWLDIGAGMGFAILDYYNPNYDLLHPEGSKRRGKKARAVAISIEDRRHFGWQVTAARLEANQIRYLSGKRLREYQLEDLGQFQLITDVYGGLSYTRDLSLFMESVLRFLTLKGRFFTLLQDVRSENGSNAPFTPDSSFTTEISQLDRSEVRVCSWLKSISCVEVTCEFRNWNPSVETYGIRKVCNDVTVPNLKLTLYEAGTPPARRFQLLSR